MQDNNDDQFCNITNLNNELQNNLEENENNNENVTIEQVHHNDVQLEENENNNDMLNYIPSNIYDPGNWKKIDTKLRELEYKNLISQFASQKARKIDFK